MIEPVSYDVYLWKTATGGLDPADIVDALAEGDTSCLLADDSLLEFHRVIRQQPSPDEWDGIVVPDPQDPVASKYAIATIPMGAVARYMDHLVEVALALGLTVYDPQLDEVVTEFHAPATGDANVNIDPAVRSGWNTAPAWDANASRSLGALLRLMDPTRKVLRRFQAVTGLDAATDLPLSDWYALAAVLMEVGNSDIALTDDQWRAAWHELASALRVLGPPHLILRVCGREFAVGTWQSIGDAAMNTRQPDGSYAGIYAVTLGSLYVRLENSIAHGA